MPFLFWWGCGPTWAMASSFTRFLDHTQRRITVGRTLLWTSDQLVAETSTWQHKTLTTNIHASPVVFEPTISAGERPQTYALDRAATGTGNNMVSATSNSFISQPSSTRIQTFVRLINTAVYAIRKRLSGCAEWHDLLDPVIHRTIMISLII